MSERLSEEHRKLMEDGRAVVVHCRACDAEYFLGELPMEMQQFIKITRRCRCPKDKTHRVLMGPLKAEAA